MFSFGRNLHHPPQLCLFNLVLLLAGCNGKDKALTPDSPRLTAAVRMRDVIFHSSALNRDVPYRVILPATLAEGQKLPAVYLLHGGGGSFHDWSNYSDVTRFAEDGLILVMPEGGSSYYTNSADHPQDRYEDYILDDLISDVERRFPVRADRQDRAIVGVSMGGFGAVKLALKHPELFAFAGGLSAAIDVPSRPFSPKRIGQWRSHESIFGPWGGETRRANDPFVLARSADPAKTPYIFLSCGEQEGLLPALRKFAALLEQRHIQFEFHTAAGGHDWNQWNARLPDLFRILTAHFRAHGGRADHLADQQLPGLGRRVLPFCGAVAISTQPRATRAGALPSDRPGLHAAQEDSWQLRPLRPIKPALLSR